MDSILEGVDPLGSVEPAPPISKPESQRARGLDEAQVPGAQEPAQDDNLAAETNHLEDGLDMQPSDAAPIIGTQSNQTPEAERSSTVITPAHDTPQTNAASEKASQPEETSLVSDEVQGQTMQTISLITSSSRTSDQNGEIVDQTDEPSSLNALQTEENQSQPTKTSYRVGVADITLSQSNVNGGER